MDYSQLLFFLATLTLLGFGVANLFFTERYFYWVESRKYASPLEPSLYKLRSMRVNGCINMLLSALFAYLVVVGK